MKRSGINFFHHKISCPIITSAKTACSAFKQAEKREERRAKNS